MHGHYFMLLMDNSPLLGKPFLSVFGGTVSFAKTGETHRNLGFTESRNRILVHEASSGATVVDEGVRWVGHELGHAFSKAMYPNTTDGLEYGQGIIDLAASDIRYIDDTRENRQIAGSCGTGNYLTSCYISKGAGFAHRDNAKGTPSEDFADMFAGYVFGFTSDDAGKARYDWMDSNMSRWISLAVTNNKNR